MYRKLQDSFCGVDTVGNQVPDPNLNAAERYGVQFRPRQSMFADRFAALKNYIRRTNSVLSLYPIVENRSFVLLNSSEPIPASIQTYVAGTFTIGKHCTEDFSEVQRHASFRDDRHRGKVRRCLPEILKRQCPGRFTI